MAILKQHNFTKKNYDRKHCYKKVNSKLIVKNIQCIEDTF